MKLEDLKPNPNNPRKLTDERRAMMEKSLKELGDVSGFVFNRRSQRLVAGHQKRSISSLDAKITIIEEYESPNAQGTVKIGFIDIDGEKFKYREVDVDETTEKAMNIASNKHSGEWDLLALPDWLAELKNSGLDMDLVGFTSGELEALLAPITPATGAQELSSGDFETFKHVCPRCGFEFDSSAKEKETTNE